MCDCDVHVSYYYQRNGKFILIIGETWFTDGLLGDCWFQDIMR